MRLRRCGIRVLPLVFGGLLANWLAVGVATAQVPANIESELVKMGHIVDPPCTAKLYRPLMPANDITSDKTPLYPGITVVRDRRLAPVRWMWWIFLRPIKDRLRVPC